MAYMERKSETDVLDKPSMPAELITQLKNINVAVQEVSSKAEDTRRNATDAILKYNELNEKYVKDLITYKSAIAAAEKKAEEAEQRVKGLETKIAAGIGHNGGPGFTKEEIERQTTEYKSFFDYYKSRNTEALPAETKTMLRTDNDVAGGYLVPPVVANQILKKVVELSPIRAFANQRPMTGKTMTIPKRLALLDSAYEGEAEADNLDASKYGEVSVTVYRHSVTVPMTTDQLLMSPFDMEAEIASDVGQSFAKKEGRFGLTGTANKMPEGILVNAEVLAGKTVTATTALLNWDDIATLIGSMKSGYDPMLFFNRLTFAQLIQIKDAYGRPLWQPVAGEKPATIWDQPYTSTFIDMDSLLPGTYSSGVLTANATSGTIPVMYADLRRGYCNYDLTGMSVIRDDVTRKRNAIIEYTFRRYHTAKVEMAEAIKVLKVK